MGREEEVVEEEDEGGGLGGVQALQAEHQLAGDRAEAGEGEDAAGGPSGKVTSRWEG